MVRPQCPRAEIPSLGAVGGFLVADFGTGWPGASPRRQARDDMISASGSKSYCRGPSVEVFTEARSRRHDQCHGSNNRGYRCGREGVFPSVVVRRRSLRPLPDGFTCYRCFGRLKCLFLAPSVTAGVGCLVRLLDNRMVRGLWH